jgi:hypothetical protein
MIKKFLLFAIASLVMLPALADKQTDKPDKGNKDGAGVPLVVVFRDGFGDKFGSDFGDPNSPSGHSYLDGVESVGAQIGKFRFGLNVGVSGTRNFFLDLRVCISAESVPEISCTGPLPALRLGNGTDVMGFTTDVMGFTTGANVFATSPDRAQYLKMGVDTTKKVNFQLEFLDDDGKDWRIMFNPSKCPKDIEGGNLATMATVTKTAVDTWEFEATTTTAGDVACLQLREGVPEIGHSTGCIPCRSKSRRLHCREERNSLSKPFNLLVAQTSGFCHTRLVGN